MLLGQGRLPVFRLSAPPGSGLKGRRHSRRFAGRGGQIVAAGPVLSTVVDQELERNHPFSHFIGCPHPDIVFDILHQHAGIPAKASALAANVKAVAEADIVFSNDNGNH